MARFIETHRDAPQVTAALTLMYNLIDRGVPSSTATKANRELQRLREQGVTETEALAAVGGVWLLSRADPGELPDDVRLTYAMALAMLKTRPFACREVWALGKVIRRDPVKPGGTARRDLGEFLRQRFGMFFANVARRIEADARSEADAARLLNQPFINATSSQESP